MFFKGSYASLLVSNNLNMTSHTVLRPKSAFGVSERRNPILPAEQPAVYEKRGKGGLTPTFFYSKYPQERPKGKIQSEYSKNSYSTFSIASEDIIEHRPSIRVNIPTVTKEDPKPQSIRVLGYSRNRSPEVIEKIILRSGTYNGSPSPILRYENQRKYCLPAEIGKTKASAAHNSSRVFENSTQSYLFNGKIKILPNKPTEISSVIGYEFALPYRDQKITAKL